MSHPRSFPFIAALIVLLGLCLPQAARAASASESCEIIHKYESFCGNLEPQTCVTYRQGFNYWGNAEHKKAWDDFFRLCGEDSERDSHECVAYLGIEASCRPTVEPQPPPVMAYNEPETLSLAVPQPTYEVYREEARLCLRSEGTETIDRFISACGDVTAAQCPQSAAVAEEFVRWCGNRSACQCAREISCGHPQCSASGTAPTGPGGTAPAPGGETPAVPSEGAPTPVTPSSPDLTPTDVSNGAPEIAAPDVGHASEPAVGFVEDEGSNRGARPVEGENFVTGALAMSGSGCSLQGFTTAGGFPSPHWILFLIPWLVLRLRGARPRGSTAEGQRAG